MPYTPVFTYSGGDNPLIDFPRLMVADTVEFAADGTTPIYVFSDQEINSMRTIQQLTFQSLQFYSPPAGAYLPDVPIPFFRIAAGLLDCMVANSAKLASITRILDVELDPSRAARWLKEQAATYRQVDDESGAILIIEQVPNEWALKQRYWNQVQRQQGTGF